MEPGGKILFLRTDGQVVGAATLASAADAETSLRIAKPDRGHEAELWRDGVCFGRLCVAANDEDGRSLAVLIPAPGR
jgi:hypothetical protein